MDEWRFAQSINNFSMLLFPILSTNCEHCGLKDGEHNGKKEIGKNAFFVMFRNLFRKEKKKGFFLRNRILDKNNSPAVLICSDFYQFVFISFPTTVVLSTSFNANAMMHCYPCATV